MATRVAAVLRASEDEVWLFGFGSVNECVVPPPEVIGPDGLSLSRKGQEDFRVDLDNGETTWAVEAHLLQEDCFLDILKMRKVIPLSPSKWRSFLRENPAAVKKWEQEKKKLQVRWN